MRAPASNLPSLVAAAGVVPTYHLTLIMDYRVISNVVLVVSIVVMFGFYGTGVSLYLFHIPERFVPGLFDYVFASHQWWHLCVFAAILSQYMGVYYTFRRVADGFDTCADHIAGLDQPFSEDLAVAGAFAPRIM